MRMGPGRLARLGTALLLVGLIVGCWTGIQSPTAPPAWGDPAAVITSLEVYPVEFVAGQEVAIEVSMLNPTSRPILLSFSSGCILPFVVENLDGTFVAPADRVCTAEAPTVELSPGEKVTTRFDWNGSARQPNAYLSPGEYQVIGGLGASGLWRPTAPVRVRILAP